MDSEFNKLWWLYVLELLFVAGIYLSGSSSQLRGYGNEFIIISLGFLTFISVFYGFIFTGAGNTLESQFLLRMANLKENHLNNIKDFNYKESSSKKIKKELEEIEKVENFESNVAPKKQLFIATFCFMFAIGASMAPLDYKIKIINLDVHSVAILLFHVGFLFSFYLINSFLILLICDHKTKEERRAHKK